MTTQYVFNLTTTSDLGDNSTDLSSRPKLILRNVGNFFHSMAQGQIPSASLDMQKLASSPTIAGSSATVTLASVGAGEVIAVNGVPFIAVSGTPLTANGEFKRGVSDTADAASFVAAVTASTDARISGVVTATSSVGVVTLRSSAAGYATNALTVETLGVLATGTLTPSGVAATDTFTINGTTFTAEQEMARGTLTVSTGVAGDYATVNTVRFTAVAASPAAWAANTAYTAGTGVTSGGNTYICTTAGTSGPTPLATLSSKVYDGTAVWSSNAFALGASDTLTAVALKAAINACTGTAISGVLTASSSAAVVTLRAVASGTAANSIATTDSEGSIVAGAATLSGGLATSNNKFDYGDTAAQCITEVLRAVAASTTALVSRQVFCTSTATLINVYSKFPGLAGNCITLAGTAGFTASVTRLAGGAVAQHQGVQASGTVTIATGSGNYTVTINGVSAAGTVAYNTSDTQTATDIAAAINSSTNGLVRGIVYASSSAGVVTVTAIRGGVSGNNITVACTGTGATASVTRLASGADPTHSALAGTGVTFSGSFAGGRLAGGAGLAAGGGSNANSFSV